MTQRTNEEQTKMGEAGRFLRFREPHGQPAQQSGHLQGRGEGIRTQHGHGDCRAGLGTGATPHPCRQQPTPTLPLSPDSSGIRSSTGRRRHAAALPKPGLTGKSPLLPDFPELSEGPRGEEVRITSGCLCTCPRCASKGLAGSSWLRDRRLSRGLRSLGLLPPVDSAVSSWPT